MHRYVHMINDFASVNLTKLDVLTGLEEVKIAVAYNIDGKALDSFPSSLERT